MGKRKTRDFEFRMPDILLGFCGTFWMTSFGAFFFWKMEESPKLTTLFCFPTALNFVTFDFVFHFCHFFVFEKKIENEKNDFQID